MQLLRARISDLGLWPRMALAVTLGFLVLFVAMSLLGERALRDSADHIFEERMVIAQIAASQIDQLLLRAVHELEEIPHFGNFDPTDSDLSHEAEILALASRETGLFSSGVVFLDTAGRVILSYPADFYQSGIPVPGLSLESLDGQDATISEPFRSAVNRQPVTAITVPIYDDGRLVGWISGMVNLEEEAIRILLQQIIMVGETSHATLLDSQGRVLASTLDLPFLEPGEHPAYYRRVMAQGQPTVDIVPLELDFITGENPAELHVQALAPLSEAPWGLSLGGDEDEILAGVGRLRRSLVLLGSAALITVWVTTLFGTRRLMRPVHHLTDAAQQIANGKLRTPLHISETGEIGAMAAALEHMRQQLLANIEELANWNETLETRVTEQTEEIRRQQTLTQQLLRRTLTAQEEERARISRELHDHIGQTLTAVGLSLDRLTNALAAEDVKTRQRLQRSRALTEQSVTDLRRVIAALRPGVLDRLGLVPALKWMSDHALRPLGLGVSIENDLQERLPGEIETTLFRIAQEAMNNVARHSQANHLAIRLRRQDGQVMMTLTDDGQGYDPSAVSPDADNGRGLGLIGMQERASLVSGQVTVESEPGQGAIVRVTIPVSTIAGRSVSGE